MYKLRLYVIIPNHARLSLSIPDDLHQLKCFREKLKFILICFSLSFMREKYFNQSYEVLLINVFHYCNNEAKYIARDNNYNKLFIITTIVCNIFIVNTSLPNHCHIMILGLHPIMLMLLLGPLDSANVSDAPLAIIVCSKALFCP